MATVIGKPTRRAAKYNKKPYLCIVKQLTDMILIADSGTTKTCWNLVDHGATRTEITTSGMNPYFQSEDDLAACIAADVVPHLNVVPKAVRAVFFYGAGCIHDKADVMQRAIARSIPTASIEVNTDLLGAARALCGQTAGIACIMGTGSNSCFYDGRQIVRNVSPLGFILGDEGSGADLGKHLLGNLLKDLMPPELKEKLFSEYALALPDIIHRVYRQPYPSRFLAGFSPFISRHLHEPSVRNLVLERFKAFFVRNITTYDYTSHKVHFVGSVAYHYQEILAEAARDAGISVGTVTASPMQGLIHYHT